LVSTWTPYFPAAAAIRSASAREKARGFSTMQCALLAAACSTRGAWFDVSLQTETTSSSSASKRASKESYWRTPSSSNRRT
jgi:hypothetical protein